MPKYRLLALDLDGTTLLNKYEISRNTSLAIQNVVKAGIIVVFSTGRGVPNTKIYWEKVGRSFPLVLLNGAEIWMEPGKLLERHFISIDTIQKLHQMAIATHSWFWGYSEQGLFRKRDWPANFNEQHWMKFGVRHDNQTVIHGIYEEICNWGDLEITKSSRNNLEISVRGTTKKNGIKKVCDLLDISMEEVMAIGDSWYDLQLIQAAGLGVAMGNGNEAIKKSC
ncbi:HAD-IIB family hydrolase [Heyndrickxia oleronia]|uniref:HAD-IIB family hydrolase n=1 Tax=Heyndrickxia oleronia TaxID=38875 RepID=UPI00204080BD|nr:HAD-IIB family hydrolase [Heyndrickxia oleronia]MCM3238555.1 HAD-IIB family hydrolase [Heyndrickxia oleronia]